LAAFAGKFNSNVVVNPTTVDTVNWHNPDLHHSSTEKIESLVIGWTGSHSTIKYLNEISPVLQRLEETFPYIQIMIIADQLPDLNLTSMVFVPWKKVSEVEDLMKIDIGIMPLPDNEWTKGKCGFKALQYMALGKPVVASDVGVNMQIIDNGVNGFLCSSKETWADTLTRLIND
jgi:glycosyltransferase involved in cell wall biosynthesis